MRRKWWPDRETKYGTGLAECLAILGSLGHPKYPSLQLLSLPVSYDSIRKIYSIEFNSRNIDIELFLEIKKFETPRFLLI